MAGNKNSGRRPKIKLLHGEGQGTPPPPAGLEPPDNLSDRAKDFWNRYAGPLAKQGLLTELDLATFELLCMSYSLAKRAEEELAELGLEIGGKKNPALTAWHQNVEIFNRLAHKFGLNPSARQGLPKPQEQAPTGPASFFGGRKNRDDDKDKA